MPIESGKTAADPTASHHPRGPELAVGPDLGTGLDSAAGTGPRVGTGLGGGPDPEVGPDLGEVPRSRGEADAPPEALGATTDGPAPSAVDGAAALVGETERRGESEHSGTTDPDRVLAVGFEPNLLGALRVASEKHDLEVVSVATLAEAAASIAEIVPGQVLSSLQFGRYGIRSLCSVLRSDPELRSVPIALISEGDPQKLDVGLYGPDRVIHPRDGLLEALDEYLIQFRPTHRITPRPPRLVGRVLLTEDSLLTQRLVGRLLHCAGAEVTSVETLAEALAALDRWSFDLILLDMEMSQMQGFDVPILLRSQGVETPILSLVGHLIDEFAKDAREYGVDGIVPKPIRSLELIQSCRFYLSDTD